MPDGNLGQDDIDSLVASLGGGNPAPPSPAAPAPAQAAAPAAAAPAAPAAAGSTSSAGSGSKLDQEQIDALVQQAAEAAAKPAVAATSTAQGQLGQSEIDKLLADLNPQTRLHAASGSAANHLSQDDIDKMLGDLDLPGAGEGSEVAKATTSASKDAGKAQTAKPASKPAAPAATTAAAPSPAPAAAAAAPAKGEAPDGPLSQDDIDLLLANLGAPTASSIGADKKATPAPTPGSAAPRRTIPPAPEPVPPSAKGADVTTELSPAEIDAIVAKQAEAPPGHDSEAVIAQSDIDALVKQLATATGVPEGQDVADAIAGKSADIDRLQEGAATPSPEMTRDAVDVNSVLGHTASTASLHAPGTGAITTTVATVGTMEWRGAKLLLYAAVLFLAVSVAGLVTLAFQVRELTGELRAGREAEHPAVEGYADKLRLALAKLEEPDEAERARGVRWMEELKSRHPERAADIGIALARHFRSREAWRRAADEFAAAVEAGGGGDDPRVLLELADCLTRLGDDPGAVRTVYALLASEARWNAERDTAGRPVAETDRARNRQAVADAYLILGRLLARAGETVAANQPATGHQAGGAEAAHPAAPAHGEGK